MLNKNIATEAYQHSNNIVKMDRKVELALEIYIKLPFRSHNKKESNIRVHKVYRKAAQMDHIIPHSSIMNSVTNSGVSVYSQNGIYSYTYTLKTFKMNAM